MEKAIKNKVAKAVVPAIDVMFQALRCGIYWFFTCHFSTICLLCTALWWHLCGYCISEFGSKIIPPKRILKMLPELFDHQDQNVRASSKGLTLELCRWIGKDPVKSILFEKMRDTMVCRFQIRISLDYSSPQFFKSSFSLLLLYSRKKSWRLNLVTSLDLQNLPAKSGDLLSKLNLLIHDTLWFFFATFFKLCFGDIGVHNLVSCL